MAMIAKDIETMLTMGLAVQGEALTCLSCKGELVYVTQNGLGIWTATIYKDPAKLNDLEGPDYLFQYINAEEAVANLGRMNFLPLFKNGPTYGNLDERDANGEGTDWDLSVKFADGWRYCGEVSDACMGRRAAQGFLDRGFDVILEQQPAD